MRKSFFAVMTGVLLIAAGCSAAPAGNNGAQEELVTPVMVDTVKAGDLEAAYEISGQLAASLEVSVIPKVSGQLSELLVKKGDRVEPGQVLAKLDDRDLRQAYEAELAALEQARMQLKAAEITKSKAEQGLNNAKIALEQARLNLNPDSESKDALDNDTIRKEQLKLQYEEAKKNLERMKALYETGDVSLQQYEAAVTAEKNAALALQQAELGTQTYEQTLRQAEIGVKNAEQDVAQATVGIQQAQSGVAMAELRVEQAKQRLEDATIVSPHHAEVVNIAAEPGEMVSMQAPLFTLVSLDPVLLNVSVSAKQLPLFENGMEVKVAVPVLGDVTKTGTVRFVSPVTDASGLYPVEIEIPNEDRALKPGMVADVMLPEVLVSDALIVPTQAIVEEAGESYVYVVEGDTAVKKTVRVIASQTEASAVDGDIQAGDTIVVKGQMTLTDGSKVSIVEEGAAN